MRPQFFVEARHALMGLWLERAGNRYVTVYGARKVKKVAPDGTVTVVGHTRFPWSPTGGLVTGNGDLWVLECSLAGGVRVERFAKDGSVHIY